MTVINTLELEGVSPESWGAAAREALREASKTIRGILRMEVLKTSATIRDGDFDEFKTQVRIYFQIEPRTGLVASRAREGVPASAAGGVDASGEGRATS
jgi:flavin-binding protein dodecin